MKVAIITQYGDNYGNKLQNYALQTLLNNMGHEAKTIIINAERKFNHPDSFTNTVAKLSPRYVSMAFSSRLKNHYPYKNQRDGIIKSIKLGKTNVPGELAEKRKERFNGFSEKNIFIETQAYEPGQYNYPDKYDAYICGSDQVWNPNFASAGYFASFAPEHKRIAFAPSFGVSKIPENLHPIYRKWLNGIPYLSVREEKGAKIIKGLTGRNVPVIPDPTLCISREQWEMVEKRPIFSAENYVITYFLGNETDRYRQFIEKYAKQRNLKIIDLYDMREPEYYSTDPAEFVWLIHHAKAVFTDSFHGTVFSLIFHVPFLVFDRIESGGTGMSSRIETLLKMVGLKDRQYGRDTNIDTINFDYADIAISEQVKKAKEFLTSSLELVSSRIEGNIAQLQFVQMYKQECTGCSACVNICPTQCIIMQKDDEGFRYPMIDLGKCIQCNKCRNLCAEAKRDIEEVRHEKAFVAYSLNEAVHNSSSSGGMFSELAGAITDMGGTVYGAGFKEDWSVIHQAAVNRPQIASLRGSKYVQSVIDPCFTEIKEKLERNEVVYFSGTPCQVNALLAFLNRDYDNLYTQDIICHGVPSPEVWKGYLQLRTSGEIINSINFRSKKYGWHYFSMLIETDKQRYVKRLDEDIYTRLFLEDVILRPACYACAHKHLHRKADVTLADCWGNTMGLKDDDRGISLVFANTEKGCRLIDIIKNRLEIVEVSFDMAALKQTAMIRSVPFNQNRELFFAIADENGMRKALEEWYGWDIPVLIKRRLGHAKYVLKNKIVH